MAQGWRHVQVTACHVQALLVSGKDPWLASCKLMYRAGTGELSRRQARAGEQRDKPAMPPSRTCRHITVRTFSPSAMLHE